MEEEAGKDQGSVEAWAQLGLSAWLCKLCVRLRMSAPTAVQAACVPAVLAGRDVAACAPTGSGKTAAFVLPLLQRLASDVYGVFAVVVTPSRELAAQIAQQFSLFGGRALGLRVQLLVGGEDRTAQGLLAARQPHVLVGTPGRLADHLEHTAGLHVRRLAALVLDEADRLMGARFEEPMRRLLTALPPSRRAAPPGPERAWTRQTLLFSATMTHELRAAVAGAGAEAAPDDGGGGGGFCYEHGAAEATAQRLLQQYVFLPETLKEAYLMYILRELHRRPPAVVAQNRSVHPAVLVFVATKRAAERLARALNLLEVPRAGALHADMQQSDRVRNLLAFRTGALRVLVATDLASRGLDIPSVDVVINVDVPPRPEDYVHRVGRTARAGRAGLAISFVTERDVARVQEIERFAGIQLAEYPVHDDDALLYLDEVKAALKIADVDIAAGVETAKPTAGASPSSSTSGGTGAARRHEKRACAAPPTRPGKHSRSR